jgi:hypothetical protein
VYQYKVYGLHIASELEIPQWIAAEGEGAPQVNIRLGSVVTDEDTLPQYEYRISIAKSKAEFKLNIGNVARYEVENGDSITVKPYPNADLDILKVYLLGMSMSVLYIQRGMLAIHGSCIDIAGRAVILAGPSGAGKSTLSAALRGSGYGFLADDISVVTYTESGIPMVHPAFAQQRLMRDAAAQLGYDVSTLPLACREGDKYVVDTCNCFRAEPLPLQALIEIQTGGEERASLSKITGVKKIEVIRKHIYCMPLFWKFGFNAEYIRQYIDIVKEIAVYSLIRPEGKFSVEEQMALVIEAVSGQP